ncbi:phosphodiester glycosidase family protein [Bacteroidia bacterium]|nr:phosphodiester glycosidase family protein [Bacteroidia bacterium]
MRLIFIPIAGIILTGFAFFTKNREAERTAEAPISKQEDQRFVVHEADITRGNLRMYWQDDNGPLQTFDNLRKHVEKQNLTLTFAMNGGMYLQDHSPQGLYIENGKVIRPLNNKTSDYGNFYLAPNGVFYLTDNNQAVVCKTKDFEPSTVIAYATQSGPMLLIDSTIHPKFTQGSKNVHIRNGVGILPNGNPLFVISTERVNLYDFASFFKKHGCKNALYLDGFVSRIYWPAQQLEQMDGHFGVLIAEVE